MSSVSDSAPVTTRCPACGKEIPAGAEACAACGRAASSTSARITLIVVLILIVISFAFTQYIVRLHRATEMLLAERWFHRGEQAMQANLPAIAAQDFRTALSYDQENQSYRLRLAEALLASNHLNEARSHLVSLWEDEPADGEVNLALARLYVRRGNASEAIRSYGNAINGVWDDNPRGRRIATRFELIRYLLGRHDQARARAEALALQADGPPDLEGQLALGQVLLQVNEPEHANDVYVEVLKTEPSNAQAWLGKGLAALALRQYNEAERAFARASENDPKSEDARQHLELVREIVHIDPALRGLSVAERAGRAAEAFKLAQKRLMSCAAQQGYTLGPPVSTPPAVGPDIAAGKGSSVGATPSSGVPAPDSLQLLYISGLQKQAATTEKELRSDPDGIEPTMQYVFEVERTTAPICYTMDVADRALLTLAQHESESVK